jgi:hypothetical protein
MRADRIAVVDDGHIVELGSHQELVARNGRYAEMFAAWTAHMGGNGHAGDGPDGDTEMVAAPRTG